MGKYLQRINCRTTASLHRELAAWRSFSLYTLSQLLERSLKKYEAGGLAIVNLEHVEEPTESAQGFARATARL